MGWPPVLIDIEDSPERQRHVIDCYLALGWMLRQKLNGRVIDAILQEDGNTIFALGR